MPKSAYGSQRKRSRFSVPAMTVAILVLGLIGGALILHAGGVIDIPLLARRSAAPPPLDTTGLVRLPVSTRLIPAYAEVTRDHISDAQGKIVSVYLNPDGVTEDMLTYEDLRLGHIVGRVLKCPKPPGYVFTRRDLYPDGTRPGPTAGVPKGKRAMRLKATLVPGLHGLNQFDRFDLVMTEIVEVKDDRARGRMDEAHLDVDGPYSELAESTPTAQPRARIKRKHAEVRTIVSNGLVILPVTRRSQIGTTSSLLRGTAITTMPVEEIVIAVDPDEVATLNLALALEAQLQVAMRSGQVSDDETCECEIPPIEVVLDQEEVVGAGGQATVTRVKVVEVIKGSDKHLLAVPTTPQEEEPRED